MGDEYWGTFSIYDHRYASLYRRALILFDRVVIPIPTKVVGTLQQDEITQLKLDADKLAKAEAAITFEWDPDKFLRWKDAVGQRTDIDSEAIANAFQRDAQLATRLQLADHYQNLPGMLLPDKVTSVIAVPVYGNLAAYQAATKEFWTAETDTLRIIINALPIPLDDVDIGKIIQLRQSEQFRESMFQLRLWQTEIMDSLQNANLYPERDREKMYERRMHEASQQLEKWTAQYEAAMHGAGIEQKKIACAFVAAIGGLIAGGPLPFMGVLAAIASPLFNLETIREPTWRKLNDKPFAPAGVIYSASRLAN